MWKSGLLGWIMVMGSHWGRTVTQHSLLILISYSFHPNIVLISYHSKIIIGKLCTGNNLAPAQLSTIPNCQWDCLRTHYHHCFGALPQSSLTEKNVKWRRTTLLSVRALPKFQNAKLAFFPLWFEFEIVQTREAQGRNHRPQSNSSWHTDQYYRSTAACLNPGNQIKRDTMNTKKWYWYTQSGWLRHHICLNGSGNSIFFIVFLC